MFRFVRTTVLDPTFLYPSGSYSSASLPHSPSLWKLSSSGRLQSCRSFTVLIRTTGSSPRYPILTSPGPNRRRRAYAFTVSPPPIDDFPAAHFPCPLNFPIPTPHDVPFQA